MPLAWDLSCHYPGCGGGNVVGKKFCFKHLKTPFETKAEVNAYRRAQKEAREDLVWLLAICKSATLVIVDEGPIRNHMAEISKRWKIKQP